MPITNNRHRWLVPGLLILLAALAVWLLIADRLPQLLYLLLLLAGGSGVWLLWQRAGCRHPPDSSASGLHPDCLSRYANDIIIVTDASGRFVEVNERAMQTFGYSREALLGQSLDLLRTGQPAHFQPACGTGDDPSGLIFEVEYKRRDGTTFPAEVSARLIEDSHHQFCHMVIRDVSKQKLAEARVQETMQRLELVAEVFRSSCEGIIITDRENRILSVNPAFCRISGFSEEEIIGHDPNQLQSGRQDEDFYQEMLQAVREKGFWQGEVWNRRKNGEIFPERLSISAVRDAGGNITHHIGILADISEYKAAQEKIQHLAHFDPLTGLPNRTLLRDRVHVALASAQRNQRQLALCFLDLDHFKNINDSLGHQAGDALLKQVAERLGAGLREQDTVARIGGDEFVLLLTDADTTGVAHVAEHLLEEVSQPYHIENYQFSITLSIGIAMYPQNGEDFDTLARCADSALYRSKQGGRNNFCFFTAEMHQRAQRVIEMETALHRALERRQLSLDYQPQVEIRSGRVIGCEALLRWRHPSLGMVSPAEFVPIAEDSGLILKIGSWIVRESVSQIKRWQDAGLPLLPVAVNLSAAQFRQPRLCTMIMEALNAARLPPACLELELTESIAMNDPQVVTGILNELHRAGFKLSIDDFGTGYSSLPHLKRFNIDKLKIDQSFVQHISGDPDDAAIVTAIIQLAHNLGLRTIAEGVENADQMAFLRDHGCDEAQGFHVSQPLSADEFAELLRKQPLQ